MQIGGASAGLLKSKARILRAESGYGNDSAPNSPRNMKWRSADVRW